MLCHNGFVDGFYLMEVQFAGQDHHIGPLGVKAEGFHVGNAELRRDVHLQADFPAVQDAGHVGGDDGIHPGGPGGVQRLIGGLQVLSVEGDIQRHVGLDAVGAADAHDFRQIPPGEIARRMRTHVQVPDSEVHGIRPAFDGGGEAVETAGRRHNFQFFFLHRLQRYAFYCYLCFR